ncbi:riboflavin biosynthesis pyrimidine reductase [Mycolicibacterium sp. BK556]|uniref:pyrimidine reductase family protein n=1 Tax=unclassified Mycolicibacterium TaxID=2636767 RepID=UPI0016177B54|nr:MULTISPECIES: pyrimidine reductase family protein [unclassified Mycolicibacterium]MBB3600893.1 riboflavin biosynthesis pyrimidine reductase [Mycolicibacterium sp. BK556]MBB3630647.1 riboflavin biosynthesis pyrimidine reductase [Mycolicibacterium sp. BK607]MBB3748641.1 riboflavin biosynthesis pyrimidine reductase [Mycolicibacterium sp. BK634]
MIFDELVTLYRDPPDGVRVNMIMSLDGAAAFAGRAGPLSDTNDQNLLLALRGYADVVLVGAGTVRAEGYGPVRLTADQFVERWERWGIESAPPIAVVTHTGHVPASLFAKPKQRPILVTTAHLAHAHPELREHADLLIAGDTAVDIASAVSVLQAGGMRRILCEGGPTLLDELVSNDLVDEMCLTVSPTLAATAEIDRPGAHGMNAPARLSLGHVVTVDDYVYLRYTRPGQGSL